MVVQHNLQAMNSSRMLNITTNAQSKNTEKLSSGYKINRASDDAAGLSISEKMRKQIRGLDRASTNASDGVSCVQTAEGALNEVHDMLQRMNELSVQAANGTNSLSDRQAIQNEIAELSTEIDRIAETTKFNETLLLKGDNGMKNMYIHAHDAGLDGTLIENSTHATFSMKALEPGDKYTIGGTQYEIGAGTNEEVAKALNLADRYNSSTGSFSLALGDTIMIDGKSYTITENEDRANLQINSSTISQLVVEGSTVVYNGNSVTRFSDMVASYSASDQITDPAKPTLITAEQAYNLVSIELRAASTIGAVTRGAAGPTTWTSTLNTSSTGVSTTIMNFVIKRGYVEVQNELRFNLHVGADADMGNKIQVEIQAMNSRSLGIQGLNVADTTGKSATYAIDVIADALQRVSDQRAELGAAQNRLEHSINNLDNVVENTTAAESRIRDTDMADAMVEYSKNNILQQAGQSMLAQANQATQGVMNLLQ